MLKLPATERQRGARERRAMRKERILRQARNLQPYVKNEFYEKLHQRWPVAPTLREPVSQLCSGDQIEDENYERICKDLQIPLLWHRKYWEFAFIVRSLERHGCLQNGKRGLGFGVGTERLSSYFASKGCEITATDLPKEALDGVRWDKSDQHASNREQLFVRTLVERKVFDANVHFEPVNMTNVPSHLVGYDFCWSACALEHLGSLQAGFEFIRRSLNCLAPGGIAVHTTEFNLSSASKTLESGPCVVYRELDMVEFAEQLRRESFKIELNLNPGSHPLDRFVDAYRNGDVHLRLYVRNRVLATSIGLQIIRPL